MDLNSSLQWASGDPTTTIANVVTTVDPSFLSNDEFASWERVLLACIIAFISIFGSIGNGMVILAVVLSRKLRTATNVYVVSLSTTDLLTCLFLPWHALAVISESGWPLAPWLCSLIAALTIVFVGSSMITLSLIALNRLILITTPSSRYRGIYTRCTLIVTTLAAWVLPILAVGVPPLLGCGELGYDEKYIRCGPLHKDDNPVSPYDLIISSVLYPVPLVIIVVSYVKIFLHIKRHTKTITTPSVHISDDHSSSAPKSAPATTGSNTASNSSDSSNNHPQSSQKQQQQPPPTVNALTRTPTMKRISKRQVEITKNLFYVVCGFVLCLTPYSLALAIPPGSSGAAHFVPFAGVILLLNSCVNPVIYAFKHPHFKTVFRYILTLKLAKIPEPSDILRFVITSRSSGFANNPK